jgi:hypothetical protein
MRGLFEFESSFKNCFCHLAPPVCLKSIKQEISGNFQGHSQGIL